MPSSRNIKFEKFYNTELGSYLYESFNEEISNYWQNLQYDNFLELGYKNIYSNNLNIKNKTYIHPKDFIENKIPDDDSFNKILVVHCFEYSNDLNAMLKTLWNIISPEGRLLIIVPNKYSTIPIININIFKKAKLFSLYEIIKLLNENSFTTIRSSSRIFLTLNFHKQFPSFSNFFEHLGSKWLIPFGSFLFIEAKKTVYSPILKPKALVKSL